MGKRIIQQRRGRGTFTYKVRSRNFQFRLEFRNAAGVVKDIVQDPGRVVPVAVPSVRQSSWPLEAVLPTKYM